MKKPTALLTYELEEEGCFVSLQSGLGIDDTRRAVDIIQGQECGCRRKLFDELTAKC